MNDAGGWVRWIPGLVLLAFFGVALTLMLAGYGAAVAVGVLSGLVLGAVVGGVIGQMLMARVQGPSVTFGSTSLGIDEQPPSAIFDLLRGFEGLQAVDRGELTRVISGGQTDDASGVLIELVALELRSSGAVAHIAAAPEPRVGRLGHLARVAVEDDRETQYVAGAMGVNGSSERQRYEIRFAPTPPVDASVLQIRIDEFVDPIPGAGGRLAGPWSLTVALTSQ
jgi:hypothetical protein